MKFSFCTIAWRHRTLKLDDMAYIVSLLGYDGIEIWSKHLSEYEAALPALKKLLSHSKLQVPMITPYFDFTSSKKKWRDSILEAETFIHLANEIDCRIIRCFTGRVGSEFATQREWKSGVEGIQVIADKAAEFNIKIAIETHVNTLADRIESIQKLLKDVNRPNVGLVLDFYNLYENERGMDPLLVIEELYEHTIHVHAKNAEANLGLITPFNYVMEKDRAILGIRNLADGDLDYRAILNELNRRDYQGYVSIECFEVNRNPIRVAMDEIKFLNETKQSNFQPTVYT
ncbi:Sugar phosphate isomerase/epimerase [Paenibacillus sp. CF095]|uniref:sugar phosphate isomerase/epimerase family protein n=1 Tax=Paenibacillus sp. CF095 TaxID=1881033 RepID=UPI0008904F57|nr:sugar phosphate isomerase/epimerase family protein [Paenibacillus sp. CF095]SDD51878.1 Sugar phosphate isomerase/epimerase [Paenibacillus sp. CF095]